MQWPWAPQCPPMSSLASTGFIPQVFSPKAKKNPSWLPSTSLEQQVLKKTPGGITFGFIGNTHLEILDSS